MRDCNGNRESVASLPSNRTQKLKMSITVLIPSHCNLGAISGMAVKFVLNGVLAISEIGDRTSDPQEPAEIWLQPASVSFRAAGGASMMQILVRRYIYLQTKVLHFELRGDMQHNQPFTVVNAA